MIIWKSIFLCTLAAVLTICSGCDDKSLTRSTYLDSDKAVFVQWSTNATHITMKVNGRTTGWLGVGFSPSGSMKGADMVIGWVKDGKGYLQDRHGQPDENGLPPLDKQRDYVLREAKENETHTIYCFERKLDTCDEDDYKLDTGTVKMIYAFNNEDPANEDENSPKYHRGNRGTLSQNIIGRKFEKPTGPDVKSTDFRMPNVSIPDGRDTYYWCQFFQLPEELNTKHHLIGYEPIFQEGQETLMHHFLIYQCVGNNIKGLLKNATGFECYTPSAPIPYLQCQTAIIGWAVGSKGTFYPEDVGFPFMNKLDGQDILYMFDVHYNNPEKINGLTDTSGIRLFYTPNLRKYEGGYMFIGYTLFDPYLVIPPKQKKFIVSAHCAKECMAAKLPKNGIKLFGYLLHTHLSGRKLELHHYRNGTELKPIAINDHYDFNFQEDVILEKRLHLLPGDSFSLECTYNTEAKNVTTIGGESTRDEMCLVFLLYYSLMPIARCNSRINPDDVNDLIGIKEIYPLKSPLDQPRIKEPANLNNTLVAEYLKTFQWSQEQVDKLQERMSKSDKIPECTGTTGKVDVGDLKTVNYPNATPYQREDPCKTTTA